MESQNTDLRLHEGELNVMELLWSNKSLAAKDIAKIIKEYIGWEKNTTYTVIKRLSERGVLKNENSVVTSLVSKEQVQAAEMDEMMEKTFEGSLPAFLAAFAKNRKLSEKEIDEVQAMIDRFREGDR